MSPFVPETWPFSIDELPDETYLVGGSVRDQLLQRRSNYLDLDLVLPYQSIETALALAKRYKAGFVVLDEARQIARVVFDQVTIDFAQQQGDHIEDDLRRRDFTVNAIAFDPHSQELIDPLDGQIDLDNKILRMVSYQNLADDPLRLMRAYRQAAQLDFTLENETQTAIGQLSPKLQQISMERVRSELDALLSLSASSAQLNAIWENRLLAFCLPHFDRSSIQRVMAIETTIAQLQATYPAFAQRLSGWVKPVPVGCYRSWIKVAKLSCLLSPDVACAAQELAQLKYSRSEAKSILKLVQAGPAITQLCSGPMDRAQQFFLFKLVGDAFLAVALLALARGVKMPVLKPMIDRFLDPEDTVAHAQSLLNGNLLMQQLGASPGPQIGKILAAVEQAQAEGQIKTQTEAIAWVKKHYILDA
ncbi:tRNA nucleotidyltransferase/poly(A) polymerase family protein [Synechococcus sp. PCC 7335]|uniref:CCA tRNA nucleotidyltransferase n=1 Tax=Synechococcus sp. (strain ATCC 29403 / PCC 7335) TaxID=91464 RepID=UPI00017EE7C5|nr:CCA tRNA nucleotidyltransferase [Synechococcus sp. PCC 7335]EDX86515.1 tRNA nucleotidyltransferase/poly(A) polymerase family protein [Synechococcus sp. PCC 7335]